jgi:hypothetical protein
MEHTLGSYTSLLILSLMLTASSDGGLITLGDTIIP